MVSRTPVEPKEFSPTAFALDSGQSIAEHSAPHTALVQVVDGGAEIERDGEPHQVAEGEALVLPPEVSHALAAPESFRKLSTMMR